MKECIARGIEPDEENVRKMAEAMQKASQTAQQKSGSKKAGAGNAGQHRAASGHRTGESHAENLRVQ